MTNEAENLLELQINFKIHSKSVGTFDCVKRSMHLV